MKQSQNRALYTGFINGAAVLGVFTQRRFTNRGRCRPHIFCMYMYYKLGKVQTAYIL